MFGRKHANKALVSFPDHFSPHGKIGLVNGLFRSCSLRWRNVGSSISLRTRPFAAWEGRVWALAYIWVVPRTECWPDQSESLIANYRMARNFRGLKISRFSRIRHEPRKFYPRKFYPLSFLTTRTAHTQCVVLLVSTWPSVVLSILCSVVVSLWLSTDIFKLRRNLVASYPILVVLSRD